jgi:hypothetical protein
MTPPPSDAPKDRVCKHLPATPLRFWLEHRRFQRLHIEVTQALQEAADEIKGDEDMIWTIDEFGNWLRARASSADQPPAQEPDNSVEEHLARINWTAEAFVVHEPNPQCQRSDSHRLEECGHAQRT